MDAARNKASSAPFRNWWYFGVSVSLYGDSALIGAHGKDDVESDAGVVYVFTRSPDGSSWTHQLKLSASDAAENDHFGISVSLYGTTALIGARFDDDKGVNAGRVYVFEASSRAGGAIATAASTRVLSRLKWRASALGRSIFRLSMTVRR